MFVAVIITVIILLILLLAVLASAIPSKPSARRSLPRADDFAPARRAAPPADVSAQLPPAAEVPIARVPAAREAAPAPAAATEAPAAPEAEPELFTPVERFVPPGKGYEFESAGSEDDGELERLFAPDRVNDDPDATDWLTGQPVSVCQCGDCRARRARNGG